MLLISATQSKLFFFYYHNICFLALCMLVKKYIYTYYLSILGTPTTKMYTLNRYDTNYYLLLLDGLWEFNINHDNDKVYQDNCVIDL